MPETARYADRVSIVIPILNEVDNLPLAIDSLVDNGYPLQCIEFVLVDGGSTDGTLEYINRLQAADLNIKLLENHQTLTAHAMNAGIEAATHDIILRADAHAYYHKNYIQYSIESLKQGRGDNVGGKLRARANTTAFSRVLAMVLNSKLGSGGAKYKSNTTGSLVDTVWCGCWYKKVLVREGLFNPKWTRNQDGELNCRFLSRGLKIYSDPRIIAELVVRPSYTAMLRQYYGYGKGRMMTMIKYPQLIKARQLLPILFVIFLVLCAIINIKLLVISIVSVIVLNSIVLSPILYFLTRQRANISVVGLCWVTPIILGMNVAWVIGCINSLLILLKNFFKE